MNVHLGCSLGYVLPDGPPNLGARLCPIDSRDHLEVLVGLSWQRENPRENICTDFYRFFGLSWENTTSMLLFDMHADFFGRFVLQRNRYIRRVELFELSSILPLLRRLEASE